MSRPRFVPVLYGLLLLFWFVSLANLNRFPVLHGDEPWILSPGYKLFTRGIYGSDLFTGFNGMEQHFLKFMPLMPLLEGLVTHSGGINVFALRFAPAACALLTIALTFRLGASLVSPGAGLLASILLVTWAWLPGGGRALGSGVPLVDLARIARYDILVPPLGLAALFVFSKSRRGERKRFVLVSGIFAGLAGLAQLYGLFWLATLGALTLLQPHNRLRTLCMLAFGSLLAWAPWIVFVGTYWTDYVAQIFPDRTLYGVLDPTFYLANLRAEPQRYHLNASVPGVWLLVAGVPFAWLLTLWLSRRRPRLLALAIPAALLFLLLALLVNQKLFNYLATVVPLFALLIAIALVRLWQAPRLGPALALIILCPVCLSGALQVAGMQAQAAQTPPPEMFMAELRAAIPPGSLVLGHQQYALPFLDGEYRAVPLLFYLCDPSANRQPVSMTEALDMVRPRFVIADPALDTLFADRSSAEAAAWSDQFHMYMSEHHATLVRQVYDQEQNLLRIYRLDP